MFSPALPKLIIQHLIYVARFLFNQFFSQQPDSSPCQSSLHDRINVKRFQCPRHFTRLVIDSWAMRVQSKYTNYAKFMHQKGRTIIGSCNWCSLLCQQPLTMLISKFMKPLKLSLTVVISWTLCLLLVPFFITKLKMPRS